MNIIKCIELLEQMLKRYKTVLYDKKVVYEQNTFVLLELENWDDVEDLYKNTNQMRLDIQETEDVIKALELSISLAKEKVYGFCQF